MSAANPVNRASAWSHLASTTARNTAWASLALLIGLGGQPLAAQEADLAWAQLNPNEQRLLAPLKDQWGDMDRIRRQKWHEIAQRYPKLPADQQERLRSRMAEWAALSPSERNRARLQFEESKLVPAEERRARWDAYRVLSDEERRDLLDKAAQRRSPSTPASRPASARDDDQPARPAPPAQVQPKSNIVSTVPARPARPVAPATVQAASGASTRTMTQRPVPPRHQQAGLPKITASPEFVDSRTLLPQRGPQGAAITPAPIASHP